MRAAPLLLALPLGLLAAATLNGLLFFVLERPSTGLAAGKSGPSSWEEQLAAEAAELTDEAARVAATAAESLEQK